jgi:hypothetical protein
MYICVGVWGGRYMVTIIKDTDLTRIPGSVKPDSKKRVVLPSFLVREDIIYHIYSNSLGQIVLDPQATVPASEAWLFKNPDAIAAVRQGLADAAQGKVSKVDLSTL